MQEKDTLQDNYTKIFFYLKVCNNEYIIPHNRVPIINISSLTELCSDSRVTPIGSFNQKHL